MSNAYESIASAMGQLKYGRTSMRTFALFFIAIVILATRGLAQGPDGRIEGLVMDAGGIPSPHQRVALRRVVPPEALHPVTTTDANGAFTFANVSPGSYEVVWSAEGRVVSTSGRIEISLDAPTVTGVLLRQPVSWRRSTRHVEKLPRTTAKELLQTRQVATSFDALQRILEPGHQVVVDGRQLLVAEVSADRLVVVRRRWFRTEEIVLVEDAVQRIGIVDPTRNGALLGTAIGGALGLAVILHTHRYASTHDCNLCPISYAQGLILPVFGGTIGAGVDGKITEAVYLRPTRTPRATLAPSGGRAHMGIAVRVRF